MFEQLHIKLGVTENASTNSDKYNVHF